LNIPDVMRLMFCRGVFCALFAAVFLTNEPLRAQDDDDPFGPGKPKWEEPFRTGGAVTASPLLSEDGLTLYVGSADRYFYAINTEDGTLKWKLKLGGPITAAATMDGESIYVPCGNGQLYNIGDAGDQGVLRWERPFRALRSRVSTPAVADDGTIYVGSTDNRLYALYPEDGVVKNPWPFVAFKDVGVPVISLISDDDEGIIYFSAGANVIGVSPDAVEASRFNPGSAVNSIPAVNEDGEIFFGANDERVYALGVGGTTNDLLWKFNAGENVSSSPVIGVGGDIFIGAESARLYCFRRTGELRWSVSTRRPVRASLSIGADGTIYAGSDDRRMYAISADGKVRWTFQTRGPVRSAAAIDAEGTIYFGSRDRNIYAVYDEAAPDDGENVWPMFRRDRLHTARSIHGQPFIFQDPLGTNVSSQFIRTNVTLGQSKVVITNGGSFLTTTNGDNVLISIVARAGAPMSFQWQLDGVDIDSEVNRSATNATLVLTNVQFGDAGQYTVRVETEFDEATSAEPFTLDVNATPVINIAVTNRFLLSSNVLVLEALVTGSGSLTYQWRLGTNDIPGVTNATLTISNALPGDSGQYTLVVVNQFGTTTSQTIFVTVLNNDYPAGSQRIAAGQRHSHGILDDQTLWSWGLQNFGQLGNDFSGSAGTNLIFNGTPQLIGTNGSRTTNAVWLGVTGGSRGFDVASNQFGGFSLGIQTNGTLWAWGLNHAGQLGIGSTTLSRVPVQVGSQSNWIQVEAGATHTLALQRDGSLWAWGANESGQLGRGNTNASTTPVRVGGESAWVEIRAGGFYSLARRADGTIWGWGANNFNQLGVTPTTNRLSPTRIGTNADWVALSAGLFHSLGVTTNGTLWAWGRGGSGQLGTGFTTNSTAPTRIGTGSDWIGVEAGTFHSFGLQTGGVLYAWGANTNGQLGLGTIGTGSEINVRVPTPVPANASNTAWVEVQASTHSIGLDVDGNVWGWGYNSHGQVGNGTTNNALSPVLLNFTNPPVFTTSPGISTQPASASVLESNAVSFSINATGAPPIFYRWYFNSNAISTAINATATNAMLNFTSAVSTNQGFYFVIVSNSLGTITSSVVSLTVTNGAGATSAPPVITQQPLSRVADVLTDVSFSVAAVGVPTVAYQWYFGNTPISGVTNPTALSTMLVISNSASTNVEGNGFYRVVVSNSLGFATSAVVSLTLTNVEGLVFLPETPVSSGIPITNSRPFITLEPTNRTVLTNTTVQFVVEALGATPLFYQWRFNSNALSSANESVTNATLTLSNVTLASSGFYDVVITNSVGSITSAPVRLTVTNGVSSGPPSPGGLASSKSTAVEIRIQSITMTGTDGVVIQLEAGAGRSRLVLEFKDDLAQPEWQSLSTNEGNALQFFDTTAPRDRARFYRVRAE
jgi:alpha-tubulin suppressor-like RCC1 family protein/outer membrane protein assembly factor BamB